MLYLRNIGGVLLEIKLKSNGLIGAVWAYLKIWGGLGLIDMTSFNLALLSKQALRILQSPSSLVSLVFQQKYFSHGNFLEVKQGHRYPPIFGRAY